MGQSARAGYASTLSDRHTSELEKRDFTMGITIQSRDSIC